MLTLHEADKKPILLADDYSHEIFCALEWRFSKFLNNELDLPESLTEDIALLRSNYYHAMRMKKESKAMEETCDLIETYHTFNVQKISDTWLYSKNGQLVLYVTPHYGWRSSNSDKRDPNYCTYGKFVKTFKPHCTTYIEKEAVKEWIDLVKNLEIRRESNCRERSAVSARQAALRELLKKNI